MLLGMSPACAAAVDLAVGNPFPKVACEQLVVPLMCVLW